MGKHHTIHCYDYINHPYVLVCSALSGDVRQVFHNATKAAALRAGSVAAELRVNIGGLEIGTDVDINVHNLEDRSREDAASAVTRLQLEWAATAMTRLFPLMKAELSVYPLTPTETQLDFLGNYETPLGALGNAVDAVIGRRIAEASVHKFVKDVAAYLRTEISRSGQNGDSAA